MLTLIEGPAGAGKSQLTASLLAAGEIDVVSDITSLWVALRQLVRGPDGKYPVRLDDDPALMIARYLQRVAVRRALEEGANVAVTTSQRFQEARWRRLAEQSGAAFAVRTVDPGADVVTARLADDSGELSAECERAIKRWYA